MSLAAPPAMDMKKPRQLRLAGVFLFKAATDSAGARSLDEFALSKIKGGRVPTSPNADAATRALRAHALSLAH